MKLDVLISFDQELLNLFNGNGSLFMDNLVVTLTSGVTWIPLYVALFVLVMKNNETMSQIMLVVGCVLLCILLSDGVTDGIVKPLVERPRPSNAANTMSIAVFFSFLVRGNLFFAVLLLWSLLNGWTRLYLGVHYPGDVLCGFLWGAISGSLSYWIFYKAYFKISPKLNYISTQYTRTGYSKDDIDMVISVMMLTLAMSVIWSLFTIGLF